MSFWSGLWVGDVERIRDALDGEEGDEETLNGADFILAHVSLPGILPAGDEPAPRSLDRLTAIGNEIVGRASPAAITFAGARRRHLTGDPDDSAANYTAFEVSAPWIEFFAGLDDDAMRRIGEHWANEMGDRLARDEPANIDQPADAEAIVELVRRIRDACRVASERGAGVVYSWTL